jgi:hypothetical protein
MVFIEHFTRHAVGAAQVAAVGDRNAQVAHRSLHDIGDAPQIALFAATLYGSRFFWGSGGNRDNFECLSHGALLMRNENRDDAHGELKEPLNNGAWNALYLVNASLKIK